MEKAQPSPFDRFAGWICGSDTTSAFQRALLFVEPPILALILALGILEHASTVQLIWLAGIGVFMSFVPTVYVVDLVKRRNLANAGEAKDAMHQEICGCRKGIFLHPPRGYLFRSRFLVGLFLIIAGILYGSLVWWPLGAVVLWFGFSHVLAGVMRYPGCPELGAVSSLLARRRIWTGCGPWCSIDRNSLRGKTY
jgi:hypothetical protein